MLLVAVALLGTGRALGQAQNTGSILGSVTDPSGAVIANASVVAAEPDKGINRTVTTSKTGEYLLPSLPVGTYILTVTAEGFETFVASDITVDADKSQKIVIKMTLGNAKETVTVNGEGTALDTNSATLGTLIDNKLVEDLPIDGRNVVALAGLLPGVTDLNAPATNTSDRGGPTFSVSGSRNTQNLMLFDGLMWNNLFYNTGINYPPPNALQEISVQLLDFKAQYGRNAGAVFNVVTKSGTNGIHGAAWDYIQNQYFNASDYITQRNPEDNSNQFGFSVEGPIKRDKLFFAVTFQDLIQHLQAIGITTTQLAASRGFQPDGVTPRPCITPVYGASDSCASFVSDVFTTPNGVPTYGKFYNPIINSSSSGLQAQPSDAIAMFTSAAGQAGLSTTNPPCLNQLQNAANYAATHAYFGTTIQSAYLPNAEVPMECLNPVVANFLAKYVPLPTVTSANGQLNNVSVAPQPRNDQNATIRIDWVASARHKIDARYNLINSNDATASGVSSASVGIATFAESSNKSISNFGNIGDAWVISPNLLNVFRAGYKRYTLVTPPVDSETWNTFGGNFVEPGVPTLPVLNLSNDYKLGSTSQAYSSVVNENIELLEQLSWTRGAHSFQFGANFLRLQYLNFTDYPGTFSFSSTFSGYSDADAAMGLLTSVQANSPLVQGGINHSIFGYAQDDWRATPKLTFNLGVRYELPFQWYQPNGYSSTFIPGHQSTVFPGAVGGLAYPGDPGVLKSLVPTDFNGVVPRIGLAYDVFGTGKLAIRAGFGMFFDAINANVIGVGEPFYFQFYKTLPSGGASVPLAQFGTNFADTRPNGNVLNVPAGYNKANPQFVAPYTLFYPDRNFRTPYYEEMNVGFELRVTRGGVLDVNYVGKMGRKLTVPFDQNPAIVDCSGGYYKANPQLYASPYCSYLVPGATNGTASSTTQSTQARLRYTPFNSAGEGLVDFASIGTSNYNGIQAQYTQRGGRFLTLLMSYSYAKSLDIQTQSETTTNSIPDVFNINSDHGPADQDVRHVLNMGWLLTLPRTTAESAIARTILNDWSFGGIFQAHTGRPYDVTLNNDSALDGEPNQRAALLPGVSPYLPSNRHRTAKLAEYFNVNAFTYPTVGTFSNQSRNSFYGPGYLLTDFTLQRYFPLTRIHEGMRMLFRADAFNVWNTPNLANPKAQFSCTSTSIQQPGNANYGLGCTTQLTPTTTIGSLNTTFGVIQSTYGNNANTSTNGRKMQFAMTVYF
jgi:outer membrane receptor protein involved in Fe transport